MDCLIWAREHGCDWNSNTCRAAAQEGHLDCLKWAREHGCDWDPDDCLEVAFETRYHNIVNWISIQLGDPIEQRLKDLERAFQR